MHALSAVSDYVIIFDILGPPYNANDRVCSYFKEIAVQGPDGASILPSKKRGLNASAGKETCWLIGDSHADNESYEREYIGDPVSLDALRMLDYLPPMARLSSIEQKLSALAPQKASSGENSAYCLPLLNESSTNPTN